MVWTQLITVFDSLLFPVVPPRTILLCCQTFSVRQLGIWMRLFHQDTLIKMPGSSAVLQFNSSSAFLSCHHSWIFFYLFLRGKKLRFETFESALLFHAEQLLDSFTSTCECFWKLLPLQFLLLTPLTQPFLHSVALDSCGLSPFSNIMFRLGTSRVIFSEDILVTSLPVQKSSVTLYLLFK